MKICSYNLQKFAEEQKTLDQFEVEFIKNQGEIEVLASKKDTDEITTFLGRPVPKKL